MNVHPVDEQTLQWLLEESNPSVRYETLTKLLKKPEDDPEAGVARRDIMRSGIVPNILSAQHPEGYFGSPGRFYLDKYTGTVWQLIILAELGADGQNKQIRAACEFILENAQDRESFGFSMNRSAKSGGGRHGEVIPCLVGNMVYSLVRLGFHEDSRVTKAAEWICRYQRCDDSVPDAPTGWPYDRAADCFGKHSCHMGVVKSLKALGSIPKEARSAGMENKIHALAEYMLVHHIHKKSRDLQSVSKPGWLKLGFPLMYQTDILEILGVLCGLGYTDSRMDAAVTIIQNKRGSTGRWKLENTFNGKMLLDIETRGEDSKWITLKALCLIKNLHESKRTGTPGSGCFLQREEP